MEQVWRPTIISQNRLVELSHFEFLVVVDALSEFGVLTQLELGHFARLYNLAEIIEWQVPGYIVVSLDQSVVYVLDLDQ